MPPITKPPPVPTKLPSHQTKPSTSQAKPSSSQAPGKLSIFQTKPKSHDLHPNAFSKGTGYGAAARLLGPFAQRTTKPIKEPTEAGPYFDALAGVLPCPSRDNLTAFDHIRHPALSAILPRSPMLRLASEILRAAAIDDISTQHDTINAVVNFVETLSSHWDTNTFIHQEQVLYPPSQQLLRHITAPSSTGPSTRSKSNLPLNDETVPETGQSLAIVIEHSAVASRVFLEAASKRDIMDSTEDARALAIMRRIANLDDLLKCQHNQQNPVQELSSKAPSPTPNVVTRSRSLKGKELQTMNDAEQWHRKHCAKSVSEAEITRNYSFTEEANKMGKATLAANRMKKIFAQIASLHAPNALPDGIYVRYGEERPDMMRFLIIGPANTPYEHGIFEFDMLCGAEFPLKPPLVKFKTTGGGKVRFNPNLYQEGKGIFPRVFPP